MRKEEVTSEINNVLQEFPGTAGIVIQESHATLSFRHNERQVFPAASLIKLPILLEYYLQVEQGHLDPLQRQELIPENIVGGSGIMQELAPGCHLTLQDMATLMIIVSDNTATNMMIDRLGISSVNQTIKAFNLENTILQRKMFDWASRDKGLENFTSAADMAKLMDIILDSERFSSSSRIEILDILTKQRINHKLPALNPPDAPWAHKTGELPGAEHDVGILRMAGKTVIAAVLTKTFENNDDALCLIREIGRIVYDAAL